MRVLISARNNELKSKPGVKQKINSMFRQHLEEINSYEVERSQSKNGRKCISQGGILLFYFDVLAWRVFLPFLGGASLLSF